MSVETFNLNAEQIAQSIVVTDTAVEHFASQLEKNDKKAVRISLKESGCTGFMYVLDEIDAPEEGDFLRSLPESISMYVARDNIAVLKDLEIDYVQQGLNKNLVMNNPNIKHSCGCGESFSV